jgi:hypothetical protein
MPSVSKKQHNFMAAVANNPAFAKKAGVPQSVGKDFNEADKGRKFSKGGDTMAKKDSEFDDDVATVKRALYKQPGDATLYSRERGLRPGMARRRLDDRGVDVRALAANEQNPDDLGSYKKGGNVKKMNMGGYADGGMTMVKKGDKMVPDFAADGKGKMAKGGMAKADMKQDKSMMQKAVNKHEGRLHKGSPMTKLAKGGMAASKMGSVKTSSSRDGIATKGKTKGKMITMKNGGKC